jgi:hypothetical protein
MSLPPVPTPARDSTSLAWADNPRCSLGSPRPCLWLGDNAMDGGIRPALNNCGGPGQPCPICNPSTPTPPCVEPTPYPNRPYPATCEMNGGIASGVDLALFAVSFHHSSLPTVMSCKGNVCRCEPPCSPGLPCKTGGPAGRAEAVETADAIFRMWPDPTSLVVAIPSAPLGDICYILNNGVVPGDVFLGQRLHADYQTPFGVSETTQFPNGNVFAHQENFVVLSGRFWGATVTNRFYPPLPTLVGSLEAPNFADFRLTHQVEPPIVAHVFAVQTNTFGLNDSDQQVELSFVVSAAKNGANDPTSTEPSFVVGDFNGAQPAAGAFVDTTSFRWLAPQNTLSQYCDAPPSPYVAQDVIQELPDSGFDHAIAMTQLVDGQSHLVQVGTLLDPLGSAQLTSPCGWPSPIANAGPVTNVHLPCLEHNGEAALFRIVRPSATCRPDCSHSCNFGSDGCGGTCQKAAGNACPEWPAATPTSAGSACFGRECVHVPSFACTADCSGACGGELDQCGGTCPGEGCPSGWGCVNGTCQKPPVPPGSPCPTGTFECYCNRGCGDATTCLHVCGNAPKVRRSTASEASADPATRRQRWVDGPTVRFGAESLPASISGAGPYALKVYGTSTTEGFTCMVEFDSQGRPAKLAGCMASDWHFRNTDIHLACETTGEVERCSGATGGLVSERYSGTIFNRDTVWMSRKLR